MRLLLVFVLSMITMPLPTQHANPSIARLNHTDLIRGQMSALWQATEDSSGLEAIIRQAIAVGAITVEQGQSQAIRDMFAREGLVIQGEIHPPPGEYRDDYSTLSCDGSDERSLWLFYHWFAHILLDQHADESGYSLGKSIEEHGRLFERVYDYDRPPTRRFPSYRYEQQAAILTDYALLSRCGDPEGWRQQYERTLQDVLG